MTNPHKVNQFEAPMFDLSVGADLTVFKDLLAQSAAGLALLAKYQEDDLIKDAYTGMVLRVIGPRGTAPRSIIGENCSVIRCTADDDIGQFQLVKMSGNKFVLPGNNQGERVAGIALNNAAEGEAVYVMVAGTSLVRRGASGPAINALFTTDATGFSDTALAADNAIGQALAVNVTINAVAFDLVRISTPFLLA